MNNCIAVMDLGTNTFHLMIAKVEDSNFTEIVHDHEAVKLGEGGINKGFIHQTAFDRGIKTMERFAVLIKQNSVTETKAIATSAMRSAANGQEFIDMVNRKTGIKIEMIDGVTEAAYIYQGVKAAGALSASHSLIMDIGGGSVEFIICTHKSILWKQSFEIGAARLIERYHEVDPVPTDTVRILEEYLDKILSPLITAVQKFGVDKLIGSAGAFETFAEVIELQRQPAFNVKDIKTYEFDWNELMRIIDVLITSSKQQRKAIKGIISLRVDMIVMASVITRYIIKKFNIIQVGMTTYSLKEGVMVSLAAH